MTEEIDPKRQLRAAGNIITMLDTRISELEAEIQRLNSEMTNAQDSWEKATQLESKIQQLKEAGNALTTVMRSGSDCGWDNAIDQWEQVSCD